MIDAMALKQGIDYDQCSGNMIGFVDFGDGAEGDEAKEALVFMAVGTTSHWKLPIGYFLTRTAPSQVQCQLVLHALDLLHTSGLKVQAIVMDGHASNVSMAKLLGCDLNPNSLKTCFLDPASGRDIFVLFDACHVLKLARNMLESYQLIEARDGKISWQYLKELEQLQVSLLSLPLCTIMKV